MTTPTITATVLGTPFDEAIDRYLLELSRDRSPNTLKTYSGGLAAFARFLTEQGMPTEVEYITRDYVTAWLDALHKGGAAPATLANRLAILKAFFRFLVDEDIIKNTPTERMRAIRQSPPMATILTDADIASLRRACSGPEFADRRARAMLELLIDSGLRRQELADLTLDDVDMKSRTVHVRHGKGDKQRISRFTRDTASILYRYRTARRDYLNRTGRHDLTWFWVGHRGRLTDAGIEEALKARAKAAGLIGFHLHQLRHYWRDRMQRANLSREAQMALGGWESDRIFRHYAKASENMRALEEYEQKVDR